MALEPAKLSEFRLSAPLGSGTTAEVYDAVHVTTGRQVAIKLMGADAGSNLELRERFAREALLLGDVDSRHVGKILGFGFDRGQPFLVLERLHGETLDAKLRRDGPVPPPLATRWIEQLIVGIRDCHDRNVIHRDIKPSNILLHREDGTEIVKLIDFGVARLRDIDGDLTGLTGKNHLLGSMGYMAPEQFKSAKSVGFPADLYAVGVVVFRTFTGRLPFVSRSIDTVIRMKLQQPVPLISSMPGMPANTTLDWFVQKAMMREAEDRFRSAREMLEQWWNVMTTFDPTRAPRASMPSVVDTPRSRPVRTDTAPPATLRVSGEVEALPSLAPPHDVEEHTIPRAFIPPLDPPSLHPVSTTMPNIGSSERPGFPSYGEVREEQTAITRSWSEPPTIGSVDLPRQAAGAAVEDADTPEDPHNQPTKNDPALHKIVERELALQHERKRR